MTKRFREPCSRRCRTSGLDWTLARLRAREPRSDQEEHRSEPSHRCSSAEQRVGVGRIRWRACEAKGERAAQQHDDADDLEDTCDKDSSHRDSREYRRARAPTLPRWPRGPARGGPSPEARTPAEPPPAEPHPPSPRHTMAHPTTCNLHASTSALDAAVAAWTTRSRRCPNAQLLPADCHELPSWGNDRRSVRLRTPSHGVSVVNLD